MCMLSNNIHDYHIVSQGKTTIPSVDDGEEMLGTEVRIGRNWTLISMLLLLLSSVKIPRKEIDQQQNYQY